MKILHTALMVFDLAKSLDFYVSKLGFKEEFRVVSPDKKFTKVFLFSEKGGHQIELIHDSSRKRPYQIGDGLAHIAFKVNDIDKVHKEWAANGVRFSQEPHHMPGAPMSMKFAFITDPDGYPFELIEEK